MPIAGSLGRAAGIDPGASAEIPVIAHPAAIALAMLLTRIAQICHDARDPSFTCSSRPANAARRASTNCGSKPSGVLTFQKLKMDVFDAQLALQSAGAIWGRGTGAAGRRGGAH